MPITMRLQAARAWIRRRVAWPDERGATAVEYGIVAVFIAAVVVVAVVFLGQSTNYSFDCSGRTIVAHSPQCP
jgi:Flp pilus assembly pilin Flp